MTTSIFNNRNIRKGDEFSGGGHILLRVALFGGGLVVAVILLTSIVRVTRIGAGYVGVEVNLAGSQRGAQDNTGSHRLGVLFAAEDTDH